MCSQNQLLVIEAKNEDLTGEPTQLTVELIALSELELEFDVSLWSRYDWRYLDFWDSRRATNRTRCAIAPSPGRSGDSHTDNYRYFREELNQNHENVLNILKICKVAGTNAIRLYDRLVARVNSPFDTNFL